MEPSFFQRLTTELRLSLATRRSELAVLAVALLMGSVFVTTRLLETPVGAPSTAGELTPTLSVPSPTPRSLTPAAFQKGPAPRSLGEGGFGGLELSPLPTQPLLSITPTASPTATPTVAPTTTVTPTLSPSNDGSGTPTPTPRTNPWAPYIP